VTESRDRIDLRPIWARVWKARARIGGLTLLAGVLTYGGSFLIPKVYRAEAMILPPAESDLLSNMSLAQRALSRFPRFGILEDYFTPADTYKAILLSRSVRVALAEEFGLSARYKRRSMEKTLKVLDDRYQVKLHPDGTLSVSMLDGDPAMAARMANRALGLLDAFNVEKRNTTAHRTRLFLERRVEETDSVLAASEAALKTYQERNKAVAPLTTSGAEVRGVADLMARKMALEVRLGIMQSSLRPDHEELQQARLELATLERQIGTLPNLQNQLLRLSRDVRVHEQLFLLLTAELEQARIRETMDTPTVQVLDPAVAPERHHRPKRLLLTAAAALLALVAQVLLAAREVRETPSVSS